jgi:predicted nucleic acid-binding Zn ribbon protein
MYCSACGTPIAPGLSYCNRCGMNLKERSESKIGSVTAFLTAIILIGLVGLGIMVGGTLALIETQRANPELAGFFMLFTFLIVGITEILLLRQLSRITSPSEQKMVDTPQRVVMPGEIQPVQPRALVEPGSSVTENTTRTLEYSRNKPLR